MHKSKPVYSMMGIALVGVLVGPGCAGADPSDPSPGDERGSSSGDLPGASTSGGGTSPASTGADPAGSSTAAGGDSTGSPGTTGGLGAESSSGAASDCAGEKVVHFVYFVEADQVFSEQQRSDIEAQAFAFQQYWYEQLGVTFYLAEPVVEVLMADHDSHWYIETPDGIHGDPRWYRLGNIKNEVYAKLGIEDFDPDHRVVNYPIARADGRVGANFGGAWMDGDDMTCIGASAPTYPYDKGGPAHCMGHVAHEVGHILGLAHEGPQIDCMQFGFYNSTGGSGMCDFSPENVAKILADPINVGWFGARPGETCVPIE